MPMLLAIDTSTRIMSLALHNGDALIAEYTASIGNKHSEYLAPMIQQLMTQSNVEVSDLSAMAVAIGPGSYTGLRIGVALAKGMSAVNDLPLVGLSTLDTIALGQSLYNTRYTLMVVVPAGRGRVIAGKYRGKKGRWIAKETPTLQTWDELLETVEDQIYLTGEITADGLEAVRLAQKEGKSITLIPPAQRLQRAGFLAEEAWRQLHDKTNEQDFSAGKVMPVYLKSPG
jgi:tRNA threonylcarbamoyladenosine biosynthesis protein TsaB